MLNTAIKAARRAGAIINRASLDVDRLQVSRKGPRDFVTEVDRLAEQSIIEILQTAYPDHGFLGEETGSQSPESDHIWIIDPLDGTTNFIHGFPAYAVSIALAHRGQVMHAVIYDPSSNELFTASRGSGAFLNDRRIRVSGRHRYADALVGVHLSGSTGGILARSDRFDALLADVAAVRRQGATVLDLAYVAAGRLDGFCGVRLKPWDVAAGGLLVLEAGGLIADFDGEQGWTKSGNVLAATPRLFPRMLAALQGDAASDAS